MINQKHPLENDFESGISSDSEYTFEEALQGILIPKELKDTLVLVDVFYCGYDSITHRGQLVVNKELENDVKAIFEDLFFCEFPIYKVFPIVFYNWSDSLSMANNNTSSFNYRTVAGTSQLSDHAYGRAIDINPMQNPFIHHRTKKHSPENSTYDKNAVGTILKDSSVVNIFKQYGWKWGGDWKYTKDYQHFYKR